MSLSKLVLLISIGLPMVCGEAGLQDGNTSAKKKDGNTSAKKKKSKQNVVATSTQAAPSQPPAPPPPAKPLSFGCGQSFYVAGSEQLSENLSLPNRLSYFRILIPACDGNVKPDFVLHLKDGAFILEAAPSPPAPPVPTPPFSPLEIFAFALAAVTGWFLLAYLLWAFSLKSQVKHIAANSAYGVVKEMQLKQAFSERTSDDFSGVAKEISRNMLSSFETSTFQKLAGRVALLEKEKSAAPTQPERAAGASTRIMTPAPPIVETRRETGLERFVRLFNAAKRQTSSQDEFLTAYQIRALQLTNTTEVAKSATAKPLFDWHVDGDLLAVRANEIAKEMPSDQYYLVPRYDKRWGTDRYTGGRWDYFFQINVDRGGPTALIDPAVVKLDGGCWELAGEQCRGEISVDTNAS